MTTTYGNPGFTDIPNILAFKEMFIPLLSKPVLHNFLEALFTAPACWKGNRAKNPHKSILVTVLWLEGY